jgi:hypothetical protein
MVKPMRRSVFKVNQRTGVRQSTIKICLEILFASTNRYPQPILAGGERAHPAVAIGAGRIVGVVEIEDYLSSSPACWQEIASLYRVKEIASSAIALCRAGCIPKREKEPTSVDIGLAGHSSSSHNY